MAAKRTVIDAWWEGIGAPHTLRGMPKWETHWNTVLEAIDAEYAKFGKVDEVPERIDKIHKLMLGAYNSWQELLSQRKDSKPLTKEDYVASCRAGKRVGKFLKESYVWKTPDIVIDGVYPCGPALVRVDSAGRVFTKFIRKPPYDPAGHPHEQHNVGTRGFRHFCLGSFLPMVRLLLATGQVALLRHQMHRQLESYNAAGAYRTPYTTNCPKCGGACSTMDKHPVVTARLNVCPKCGKNSRDTGCTGCVTSPTCRGCLPKCKDCGNLLQAYWKEKCPCAPGYLDALQTLVEAKEVKTTDTMRAYLKDHVTNGKGRGAKDRFIYSSGALNGCNEKTITEVHGKVLDVLAGAVRDGGH